jgi:hypothetical protein
LSPAGLDVGQRLALKGIQAVTRFLRSAPGEPPIRDPVILIL